MEILEAITPLAPAGLQWARGRVAIPLSYLYGKFLHGCVPVLWNHRSQGRFNTGGRAPESVIMKNDDFSRTVFLHNKPMKGVTFIKQELIIFPGTLLYKKSMS